MTSGIWGFWDPALRTIDGEPVYIRVDEILLESELPRRFTGMRPELHVEQRLKILKEENQKRVVIFYYDGRYYYLYENKLYVDKKSILKNKQNY